MCYTNKGSSKNDIVTRSVSAKGCWVVWIYGCWVVWMWGCWGCMMLGCMDVGVLGCKGVNMGWGVVM